MSSPDSPKRSLIWLGLFAIPSIVYAGFWIVTMMPWFRSLRDPIIDFLLMISFIELMCVSFAYGARHHDSVRMVGVSVGVFLLATLANAIAIVGMLFAGCAWGI